MTVSRSYRFGDFGGIRVSGGSSDFPDLVTEQIVSSGALDPQRVVILLVAADAATFLMCEASRSGATGPDFRTWHVCGYAMAAERAAGLMEWFPDPAIAVPIRLIRN